MSIRRCWSWLALAGLAAAAPVAAFPQFERPPVGYRHSYNSYDLVGGYGGYFPINRYYFSPGYRSIYYPEYRLMFGESRAIYGYPYTRSNYRSGLEPPGTLSEALLDLVSRQLVVERSEGENYVVRWAGPTEDLAGVEVTSVDAQNKVLGSRSLKELPLRGSLRVPRQAAAVVVTLSYRDGTSATVRVPVERFRDQGER